MKKFHSANYVDCAESEKGGEVFNNEVCIKHCLGSKRRENANYLSSIWNQSLIYLHICWYIHIIWIYRVLFRCGFDSFASLILLYSTLFFLYWFSFKWVLNMNSLCSMFIHSSFFRGSKRDMWTIPAAIYWIQKLKKYC